MSSRIHSSYAATALVALTAVLLAPNAPARAGEPFACCLPDGTCEDLSEADCLAAGGEWVGGLGARLCEEIEGTPLECQPPSGACCTDTGKGVVCTIEAVSDCIAANQTYQGDDTVCSPDPCVPTDPGACCLDDDSCSIELHSDCDSLGGNWLGEDTLCSECPCVTPCPPGGLIEGEPVCFDDYVDTFNGGCDVAAPAFSPIQAGETICGQGGVFDSEVAPPRDSDWYEIVVTAPTQLVWTVEAEFPVEASIVNGNIACPDGAPVLSRGVDIECSVVTVAEPAHPGTYWLVTAPSSASDLAECGARYTAHLDTVPLPWEATEVGLGVQASQVGNWDGHPVDYRAADIWADDRDLAYVANRDGATIDIMDILDPANPTLLTTYQVPPPNDTGVAKDVKVHDGLMYIVLDQGGAAGAQIVDVRDPANPQPLVDVAVPEFLDLHNLFFDAGFLYLANSQTPDLAVVDLTGFDPDNPPAGPITQAKWVVNNIGSHFVHDVTVLSGRAYFSAWDSGIWVYDVTDVANVPPILMATAPGDNTHSAWASRGGRWVVTNEERDDGGPIKLYEMTQTEGHTLTHVFTYSIPTSEAVSSHNVYVVGHRVYCAWYNRGLMAFDIHPESKSLVLVAHFDTNTAADPFNGAWGIYPFLGRDRVMLSDKETQFWIFDVRVPGSGDYDGDGDVDLIDFIGFQDCFRGDGVGLVRPDCDIHDFDADNDVDPTDYAGFFAAQTGPR